MKYINLVAGDELYKIKFHITNDDETSINLTNSDALFNAVQDGSTDVCVSGNCEVVDGSYPLISGYCAYEVQNGEFVSTGLYDAEIQVTYTTTNEVITAPNIRILVQGEL